MPLVSTLLRACLGVATGLALFAHPVVAFSDDDIIEATSLHTCMANSKLTADHFKVAFTPINSTVSYNINITAEIQGYVTAAVDVYAYGFKIISKSFDPCTLNANGLCPVSSGSNFISSTTKISSSIVNDIPSIAFTFPDIDAFVIVKVYEDSQVVACIQADLSNRKTVNHVAVKWVTAVIAGIGLLVSAIVSTMGSTYTAAHIAANSVSLFSYFQSVVIVSMCAVQQMPPIASAWAQNIAWSVGLIKITFMQKIFRWYVAATGGTPSQNILSPSISVLVQKRDIIPTRLTHHSRLLLHSLSKRVFGDITRRDDQYVSMPAHSNDALLVLRGIKRVAYQANIERTSAVLTAFTFFVLICVAVAICFFFFYGIVALTAKSAKSSNYRFSYFHKNCFVILKGTLLRLLFIAFPSLLVFSFWEFVQHDSAAVIVLAVFFLVLAGGILGWSSVKVYLIGKQSAKQHNTPAYILFSDPNILNRYGFLYVPYKALSYYFIIPVLGYYFLKACFVSFAQGSGKTQGLALFLIELAYLVGISFYKPYMDKSTNVINIIIAVVTVINAFLVMFFSQLFNTPRAVASVMGIVFFILNAVFSLILLLYTIISCGIVLISRNPDNRYRPAADDRAAFIRDPKSNTGDAAELTALGVAAQADHETNFMDGEYARSESNYEVGDKNARTSIESSVTNANPFSEKNNSVNQFAPAANSSDASFDEVRRMQEEQDLERGHKVSGSLPGNSIVDPSPGLVPPSTATGDIFDQGAEAGSRDSRDSYNMGGLAMPSGTAEAGHPVSQTYSNLSLNPHDNSNTQLQSSSSQSFLNEAAGGASNHTGGEEKRKSKWKIF